MRILVTGRSGQVALSLAEFAPKHPEHELVFASRPAFDLTNPMSIAKHVADVAPDVIINAAAYTAVDLAEDEASEAWSVNADGPAALARAAEAVGARIIHLSTDYVFDGGSTAPLEETRPVAPINAYGASKLAGEIAVRAASPNHVIIRTAWVYSPFGANFVKTMLRLAETRPELSVVADQTGSPTSAQDLAGGIMAVVSDWAGGGVRGLGETYHLAGAGSATWAEFAAEIFSVSRSLAGPSAAVVPISSDAWPTRAVRPRWSVMDNGKFQRDFGFTMPPWQVSAAEVVQQLLRPPTDLPRSARAAA